MILLVFRRVSCQAALWSKDKRETWRQRSKIRVDFSRSMHQKMRAPIHLRGCGKYGEPMNRAGIETMC
jgi:hypothetical protein